MTNSTPTTAPYGSWRSPITADAIVAEAVGLGQVAIDGDAVLWTESRPSEGGRYVVVRMTPDGQVTEVNPPPFNARTRVHEYGGGAWLSSGGVVWFSNFDDQRIYRGGLLPPLDPPPHRPAIDGCTISGVPVASTSILPSGWHRSASNLPTQFGDALDLSTATAWGGWGGRGCFACLGSDTKEGRERYNVPATAPP